VAVRIPGKQQNIALPLVIPLSMEMVDIVAQRSPQRALAEEDYPLNDLVFFGSESCMVILF
jgi:hypothetical protein